MTRRKQQDWEYLNLRSGRKNDYHVYKIKNALIMKKVAIAGLMALFLQSCGAGQSQSEAEFFVFEPDIRLFTSYAFMNAAGYDHDWNPKMHPIRIEVREFLDSILTEDYKKDIHEYYEKFGGGDFCGYGVYAINSKNPPDFGLLCDSCRNEDLNKFASFDSLLKDFYEKANIPELWKREYQRLNDINLQYKPFAEVAIKQITEYCRVDSDYFRNNTNGRFYYQQIPLMSYFTAFFYETGSDNWVISGPTNGEAGPGAFYHEPLHKIINPIVEAYPAINIRIKDLADLAQERLHGDYNDVTSVICESLVRTIDRIICGRYYNFTEAKLREIVEDEYRLGHILSFYLLENLSAYETGNKTLKEYYPELISNIDIKHEKERWESYWKNQGDK